jgi:hypothetical protein
MDKNIMTQKLREGAKFGVIMANGGNATYHHSLEFSSQPAKFVNKQAAALILRMMYCMVLLLLGMG